MINIDFTELNCKDCPAIGLKNLTKIKRNEQLRINKIQEVDEVKIILLGESTPANRFVYNLNSDYSCNGFRYNLRWELIDGGQDDQLLNHLKRRGIIIVDCAFCPLHQLDSNTLKRDAATKCLSRHTKMYLDQFPDADIITFFPNHRGFKKTELTDISSRVVCEFSFSNLTGLRAEINRLLNKQEMKS